MRRHSAILAAGLIAAVGLTVAASVPTLPTDEADDPIEHVVVGEGENLIAFAERLCPNDSIGAAQGLHQINPWLSNQEVRPGTVLHWDDAHCPDRIPVPTITVPPPITVPTPTTIDG